METLPASAASSTLGWGVRSLESAAHDAEHWTTPRTQTEPGRSLSAPQRSRWRPSAPCDWSSKFAKSGKVASAGGEDIWPRSIVPPRSLTRAAPRECGVLPTTGSHGSCSESSREFLPVRLVFPDAVVTSASSTTVPSDTGSIATDCRHTVQVAIAAKDRRRLFESAVCAVGQGAKTVNCAELSGG